MGDQGEEGRPARAALYRSTVRLDQNSSIVASGAIQVEEGMLKSIFVCMFTYADYMPLKTRRVQLSWRTAGDVSAPARVQLSSGVLRADVFCPPDWLRGRQAGIAHASAA